MNTKVGSVTSEPFQSSSTCVSFFKNSSALEHLRGDLYKSEVLVIVTTLFVTNNQRQTIEMRGTE